MKIHFGGLNALRFYAALSVVVQHIMYSPHDWFGVPLLPDTVGRLFINGTDAVDLFFVLSGFLITYLLLVEREKTGTVQVRRFYLRRILRIWPVYFLILFITGFVLPRIAPDFKNPLADPTFTLMMLFFLGNIAFPIYYPFPPLEHLWSIAVEEQFYLAIPFVARSGVNLVKFFITVMVACWVVLGTLSFMGNALGVILITLRYDCIAIGGLFACAYYYQHPVLKWIYHPVAGFGSVAAVMFMAVFVQPRPDLLYTVISDFIFGVLILNVATNPRFPLKFTHPVLEYLGNLSYSIYMYHPLLLLVFFKLFYGKMGPELYQILAYPIVIILSLGIALVSYRFYETPFLRLKERFKMVTHE